MRCHPIKTVNERQKYGRTPRVEIMKDCTIHGSRIKSTAEVTEVRHNKNITTPKSRIILFLQLG
jgi:hypothetical protein